MIIYGCLFDIHLLSFLGMVSNICCEFHKPVTLGEEVIVKTWPTPPTHVIFGREYQVLSKRKVPLVSASSRWCLIDMSNGKILQSKMIDNQNYSTYNKTKLLEDVQWKIPVFPKEEGEEKFSLKIANSEYDHNMHVNNTKYADYCFNCFTVEELAGLSLKRFMITYVKQCKEGDNLVFYRKEQGEGEYLVQGFNGKNELVVQSRIYFDKGAETI